MSSRHAPGHDHLVVLGAMVAERDRFGWHEAMIIALGGSGVGMVMTGRHDPALQPPPQGRGG